MSITVKTFDEQKAKDELKKCPKIVQQYVKLLQDHIINLNDLNKKAIGKLISVSNDL